MTLCILVVVTIILISITYRLGKSFHLGVSIHLHLKRELKQVQKKLSFWKDHPAKQFEVLQPIYQRVSYAAFRHNKSQAVRIEKKVNDELNLLIKNKMTSFYASCLLVLKGIVVLIGLFFSLGNVLSVYEEYQITSFKIDTKPITQSVTEFGQAFNQWFTSIEWESESEVEVEATQEIILPKNSKGMNPQESQYTLPEQIMDVTDLGRALAYHMNRQEKRFSIQYVGDTTDFGKTIDQAWNWLEINEPYVFSMYEDANSQYTDYDYYIDYELAVEYEITRKQAQQVREKVNQIVRRIPENWSDEKKIRYVNDYVVRHTAYNLKSKNSPYTPYSILMDGEGVCDGYALTTLLLLEAAKVDVRYVVGKASGGLHAWNMVKIKGSWYHLDTTWNDPFPNEVQDDYLLVSDKTLREDHSWNARIYPQTPKSNYQ